jgi:hypothetical protein
MPFPVASFRTSSRSTKPLSTSEFMTLMQLRLLIFVVAAISLYLVKHSEVPRTKVISKSALMTES